MTRAFSSLVYTSSSRINMNSIKITALAKITQSPNYLQSFQLWPHRYPELMALLERHLMPWAEATGWSLTGWCPRFSRMAFPPRGPPAAGGASRARTRCRSRSTLRERRTRARVCRGRAAGARCRAVRRSLRLGCECMQDSMQYLLYYAVLYSYKVCDKMMILWYKSISIATNYWIVSLSYRHLAWKIAQYNPLFRAIVRRVELVTRKTPWVHHITNQKSICTSISIRKLFDKDLKIMEVFGNWY